MHWTYHGARSAILRDHGGLAGARSGKDSRIAAPVACYEALFGGHEAHLSKGERGVIVLVAQDLKGTRVAFSYIRDYLIHSSLLASRVSEVLASEIVLTNGLTISCFPCTMRSLRGWSIPVAVLDEVGFFPIEGTADADVEIQASIRRGMVGFPSPRLLKISTPYIRSGVLWDDFQRFGEENPVSLVWKASTHTMFPGLHLRLEAMRVLDPQRFSREYEAEFAGELEAFLPAAWVDAAVVPGRGDLPPQDGVSYVGACDPAGGGPDAFTVCVCHVQGQGGQARAVVDALRGWSRAGSNIGAVVKDAADVLRRYRVYEVEGDPYGSGFVRGAFQEAGIVYKNAARDKSAAYLELEPLLAQGRVEFPDHPTLVRELKLLERRPPRAGGRPAIDHPRGAHDDYAVVCALAAVAALSGAAVTLGPEHFWTVGERATAPGRAFMVDVPNEVPRYNSSDRPWDPGVLDDAFHPPSD